MTDQQSGGSPTREKPGPYGFTLTERLKAALDAFLDPTIFDLRGGWGDSRARQADGGVAIHTDENVRGCYPPEESRRCPGEGCDAIAEPLLTRTGERGRRHRKKVAETPAEEFRWSCPAPRSECRVSVFHGRRLEECETDE